MANTPDQDVVVTFKEEGLNEKGEVVGPVEVIDVPRYNAWLEENGLTGSLTMPFGSKPDGVEDKGYMTITAARRLAKKHGVELKE